MCAMHAALYVLTCGAPPSVASAPELGLRQVRRPMPVGEAPYLEPDPPTWAAWLLETQSDKRLRCARNHVRALVRGRRAYRCFVERAPRSFVYPERLWMALACSLWTQLLIILFFYNVVRWLSAVLTHAESFHEKLADELQHDAAITEAERFAPLFHGFMILLWAVLAPGHRAMIVASVPPVEHPTSTTRSPIASPIP